MKKISTLFKKDPDDLGRVISQINPEHEWVFMPEGIATRKFDGTACAIIGGILYKRYDVKKGKTVPEGAIPCQEADEITGHWPHWVKCVEGNPEDKYHFEAFGTSSNLSDGTYELCGPKINGNKEGFAAHVLVRHGEHRLGITDRSFNGIKAFLAENDVEGIVFHHHDGRMAKIRKSDFGIKRT
jgi:hypothetical protein